jgi:hypothetical protein
MNIDRILETFNRQGVEHVLLGGMNFLLRHKPVLTFDVDFWINDTQENRARCEKALVELDASWGATDEEWESVKLLEPGWLSRQAMYCTMSPHGAIDIFRTVKGLGSWIESAASAARGKTANGTEYLGLSDKDMLKCQYALEENQRKLDRIRILEETINGKDQPS